MRASPRTMFVLETLLYLSLMLALAAYYFYTGGMDAVAPGVVYNQF